MKERRRAERVKSLLKARIYFNNRMTSFDCVVKNISLHGAKVAIDKNAAVPDEFELEIPLRGKFYQAKLRWRDAEGIGMEFIEEVAADDPANPQFEQLKAENARLKTAVQILTKKLEDLGQDIPKLY
ncbi:MAG: PilZ domain-containing protein [Beijerinckiaceae bacterium]